MNKKYYSQIIIFLVLLLSIPLHSGFVVYIGIIFFCLSYFNSNEPFKAFLLSFSIYFLLPYDFNSLILGGRIGNYFNNAFLTSLPLLICLPLISKEKVKTLDKKLKFVMIFFFIILFYSTIGKGFLSFFMGGERIRIAYLFYFVNGFLLVYWGIRVLKNRENIKNFIVHIIILGTITSFLGIFQYVTKINLFNIDMNKYQLSGDRLFLIPFPDAVGLFPYIVVPFSFAMTYLLSNNSQNKNYLRLSVSILFIAQLFTWGRWGLFTLIMITIFSFWIYRRKKIIILLLSTVLIVLSYMPLETFIPNREISRIESRNNLVIRMILWGAAIESIKTNLIFGVGLGNAAKHSFDAGLSLLDVNASGTGINNVETIEFQSIHNFYLEWILSMGIFVLFPLCYMYYLNYRNYKTVIKLNIHPLDVAFMRGIIASLLGLTIFLLQNSGNSYNWLFLLFAMTFILKNRLYYLKTS